MNNLEKPITDESSEKLRSFIFVDRNTHLKIVCRCPECGTVFFRWLLGGHDKSLEEIVMEMHTSDCAACLEEKLEFDELCEEESFNPATDFLEQGEPSF